MKILVVKAIDIGRVDQAHAMIQGELNDRDRIGLSRPPFRAQTQQTETDAARERTEDTETRAGIVNDESPNRKTGRYFADA